MKVTADTNILARAVTEDDPVQARLAQELLSSAALVAMPLTALCELCWVLSRSYRFERTSIAQAIRALTNGDNVETDHLAVDAGLAMLEAGGDFGDGVIAHQGAWLGAETFASFDKKAVALLKSGGRDAFVPA